MFSGSITLVIPAFSDFYATPGRSAPLGAAVVADMLRERDVPCTLVDLPGTCPRGTAVPLPRQMDHLRPFLIPDEHGPTAFFTSFRRFGPAPEVAARCILQGKPDIILISLFAWCYAADTAALCGALKSLAPSVPVFVGGAGASVHPEWILEHGSADGVLCGEAENVLPEFLDRYPDNLPPVLKTGIADAVRPAAAQAAEGKEGSRISLSLTRGCGMDCAFCANSITHGKRFRTADLSLLDELLARLRITGRPTFNLEDDNLLLAPEYFREAAGLLRRRFPGCRLAAENGLDYRLINGDTAAFLAESGFRRINLSLGTISPEAAVSQKRPVSMEKYESALTALISRGLPVTTYFICGLPGDSPEDTVRTLLYLGGKETVIGISPFYAVPGLPGFPPEHPDFRSGPHRARGMALWPWSGTHTTGQLMTAFRLTRFLNLLKSGPSDPLFRKLKKRILETGILHTLKGRKLFPVRECDPAMCAAVINGIRTLF